MATRLKTVKYAFPALASLVNNTLTTLTQITIYLPETGTKTFRSVVAHVTMNDIITVTGGSLTTKTLNCRLGAAAYTSVANANTLTNSGENASFWLSADYTSHFTTNWTGTSMTCDFQLQINQSTGTTTGMVNVCVTLDITYEYDDTSTTHVKTVMIPLNAPVAALTTGAVTYDTAPALDTYLPESTKTYRQVFLVVQGNTHNATSAVDHTMTLNFGASTVTTGNYEAALGSDRFFRYVWNLTAAGWSTTGSTQTFQASATVARVNHFQAYLVVTYEFDPSASTTVMNSLMLPMDLASPMGGTTSSDYQRGTRELFIQEPTTITTSRVAYYVFWQQIAAISTLNMRIGTGTFTAYTDAASVTCGTNAAMVRNDTAFTLARGRNTLNFDVYRSDTTDFGWNISGFWIVNYTSGKATAGVGAHNHTIEWSLAQNGTAAAATNYTDAASAPVIPETEYFITAAGNHLIVQPSGTVALSGMAILIERLAAEGGIEWEPIYIDSSQTDPEIGVFFAYAQSRTFFKRWPGDDYAGNRVDIETARRRRVHINGSTAVAGWISLNLIFTYHSITYTISGTVSGSSGGTVTIGAWRPGTGEKLLQTSRTGNGTYSLTWYDNTESVFTEAYESGTLVGRSDTGTAA